MSPTSSGEAVQIDESRPVTPVFRTDLLDRAMKVTSPAKLMMPKPFDYGLQRNFLQYSSGRLIEFAQNASE